MKNGQRFLSAVLVLVCLITCLPTIEANATNYTSWYSSRKGQTLANISGSNYNENNPFSKGQCTWYCFGRALEKCGVYLPPWKENGGYGNADEWYDNAASAGFNVGYEVRSNSIACFSGMHVIFIEWVDGETVYYTEANKDSNGIYNSGVDCILVESTITKLRQRLNSTYQGCIYLEESGYEIDTRYPSFYAYTLSASNVDCYFGINGSRAGSIYPDDKCLVEEVYTNGWCRVNCPWPSDPNGYKIVYVPLSTFIYDTNYYHSEHTLLYGTQGYRKSNMSESYEWLDAKTYALRVSKVNGLTQVIAWKEGVGNHLTWINHTGDYIKGMEAGSDFYAYIINTEQWRHVTDDQDNVTLRKQVSNETQIWHFIYQGNGYYKIKNALSGEDLLVQYAEDKDGANITTLSGGGTDNELWMLCGVWDDGVTLEPKHSIRVMDVCDNSTAEGANIQLWTYNGTGAQKFKIWRDLQFTIWYDANGGSNPPSSQGGQKYLAATTLAKEKPTAPSYTITYNANGGSVSAKTKTVSPSFKNWNTSKNGTGTSFNSGASIVIHGDTTLYAQWNSVKVGTLATPTRSGYTFNGWYTAENGGTKITADTVVTRNMTLYAQWKPVDNFTVIYNANGGTGAPGNQTKTNGKALTLSKTRPTRFGFNFQGWATSASATSAAYQPGDSFTIDANTTLYAVWSSAETISTSTEAIRSPVSEYGKSGYYYKLTPGASTSYRLTLWDADEEGIVSVTLYDSNKNVLTKISGTDDEALSEFECTLEYHITAGESYFLYAEYTDTDKDGVYLIISRGYLISYDANGGTDKPSSEYHYYGSGPYRISPEVPTRKGYTFAAWNTMADGSGSSYSPGDYLEEGWGDYVLYALWQKGCSGIHNYKYTITKIPTTGVAGTLKGTCSDCGDTTTVTLPKLNTTDYTYKVVTAATCTANGTGRYTWKTTTYGSYYFDVPIAATGHHYVAQVTKAPTCIGSGIRTYTCNACSSSYTEEIPATGVHTYDTHFTIDRPATADTDGEMSRHCTTTGSVSYTHLTLPTTWPV